MASLSPAFNGPSSGKLNGEGGIRSPRRFGRRLRDMAFSLPLAHPDMDRECRSLFLALLGGKIPFSSLPYVLLTQNHFASAKCSSFTTFIRRGWDSNPRYSYEYTHFPGVRFRPLSHLSRQIYFLLRSFLKNFVKTSEHSFFKTPFFTFTLWLRCFEETTFIILPQAPAFGSSAP
jgi:hypothetical protein